MSAQPFYHLRPNKFIDRYLFVQTLSGLSKILPISTYQYIGFGSFQFDDFKVIHNQLGISDMVSLESDSSVFKRALFNKPYKCIEVENATSSNFIANTAIEKPSIIWLDYTDPKALGGQFADFCDLLDKMNPNDIIRITLNANPSALGGKEQGHDPIEIHKERLKKLTERIKDHIPTTVADSDMTSNNYPLLLLACLKKAASKTLVYSPPYQNKYLFPLFSSVYKDGQQMVTLTAIILNSKEQETMTRECLHTYTHILFDWDKPCNIQVPALTTKEIMCINNLLPDESSMQQIKEKYLFVFGDDKTGDTIKSYIDYYKYYPNFHHVSL